MPAPAVIPRAHVEPTGLRVLSIPRPTPDVVRVSLWIDAGSRDGAHPDLATLAAWSSAMAAGPDVHSRVLPDAIEFWTECGAGEIDSAVAGLARVLSLRSVPEATFRQLQQQRVERHAQQAIDSAARAPILALHSALPGNAQAWLPLADDGGDEIELRDVQAFLAEHWGPSRALLVAIGDVHAAPLSQAIGKHLASVPPARSSRQERALDWADDPIEVRVDRANASAGAIAIVSKDRAMARRHWLAVQRSWAGGPIDAQWIEVRGGVVATVSVATAKPTSTIDVALRALARIGAQDPSSPLPSEDLAALSERAGLHFAAPAIAPDAPMVRVGVAATLPDRARTGPPDEARAHAEIEELRRELQAVVARAARAPRTRGQIGEHAASVVLDNGARLVVQRRQSEQVALALSFQGGASEEPARLHGRAALLSRMMMQACQALPAGALQLRLQTLGAHLEPALQADSVGLRITLPRAQWREGLTVLSECALRPLLERRALRDVQARMLRMLQPGTAAWNMASAAQLLMPGHPSAIAPLGGTDSALVDLDVVMQAHAQLAVGSRIALAIVGDVNVRDAVSAAARELADAPSGTWPRSRPAAPAATTDVTAWNPPTAAPAALIGFVDSHTGLDAVGARTFAALLSDALAQQPGVQVQWTGADRFESGAWAGVVAEVEGPESLETLHTSVANAQRSLLSRTGRALATRLIQRALRQHARAQSEPRHQATALVESALGRAAHGTDHARALQTFEHLARGKPRFAIWRGSAPRPSATATQRTDAARP